MGIVGNSGVRSTGLAAGPAATNVRAAAPFLQRRLDTQPLSREQLRDAMAAMAMPWLFDMSGIDPAFGSGPVATVIQDLLSIWIYLLVATSGLN